MSLAWMNTCGATPPTATRIVTVVLEVTPIRDRRGLSQLLDMVSGRSKKVFKTWLASQPDTWRERIEIVAMDGFTGFKSAAAEELPDATTVMDPFHVVHLAGNALDECRRRIQQELHHRRGRATDPLYKARRMLHTRSCLLTVRQRYQILDLFSGDEHVALEVTWSAYQNIIDAYRAPNTSAGKVLMRAEINTLTSTRVPRGLTELITLGRTLKRRAGDVLAYFDHPHTTGVPTEAINAPLSNTYADPHSGTETSPTTSPEHSSKQEDSDPNYTLNYEEPDHPTARLSGPGPRTPPACSMPFTSSRPLVTLQVRCVVASSKTRPVTAGVRAIPSTQVCNLLRASHTQAHPTPTRTTPRGLQADEAHISVEVAYHCAQQVREVFHQATPTQRRRLATHLIQRLPTCPIPEIARLGRTLRKWKDAFLAYFDTGGASNAPHRSHQQTLSSWADTLPKATPTPPTTSPECPSSQEA